MSAGARKAEPGSCQPLVRVGGVALAVALIATVAILVIFGDCLVADDPADKGDTA